MLCAKGREKQWDLFIPCPGAKNTLRKTLRNSLFFSCVYSHSDCAKYGSGSGKKKIQGDPRRGVGHADGTFGANITKDTKVKYFHSYFMSHVNCSLFFIKRTPLLPESLLVTEGFYNIICLDEAGL